MSCPNSTAPVDISISKITGNCDLKCDYTFNYNNSSCIATNRGDYISLSYDKSTSPPVIYNSVGYDVNEIRIYTPSLHSYNGTKSDGELIIIHKSNSGSKPVFVCIPIKVSSGTSSQSAVMFNAIISAISKNAPANGESTTVNIVKYNLSLLVPKTSYFSYSGTEAFQPCVEQVDYIVFDILNGGLDISSQNLEILNTIIKKNVYDVKPTMELFLNKKGPTKWGGSSGDQIYIDCQPVGASSEEELVVENGESEPLFSKDMFNLDDKTMQLLLGSIIFIALLVFINLIISWINPSPKGNIITNTFNNLIKGNNLGN